MAFTFTANYLLQTPEGTISQTVTSTGSRSQAVDQETIPTSTTDQLLECSFAYATLKAFWFICDKDIQIETNTTNHSGGDVISILANVPLLWQAGMYFANPFTADVTKMYLTTGSVGTATYSYRILDDGTPP